MKKRIRYRDVFLDRLHKVTKGVDVNTENTSSANSGMFLIIPILLVFALFEYLYLLITREKSDT